VKILFLCGAGRLFGKERVTLSLIKGLRDRGHKVMCLTSTWKDGKFEKQLQQLSIPYGAVPLGFISKSLSLSSCGMTLAQLFRLPELWLGYMKALRSFRPDVVIHSDIHHLALLWPVLGQGIHVFHVHDAFQPTNFYRRLFQLFAMRVSIFVGVSRFVAGSLADLGVPKSKIDHVLNGIAVEHSPGQSALETANSPYPVMTETTQIGIVGQIDVWKGHEDLIEALRILQAKHQPFFCRIFGAGSDEFSRKLKRSIEEYKLTDRVRWMGFMEERESIYDQIDVCVVPSRIPEAFGIVAAEAALFGIPTVTTRQGGLAEVVQDGETGFVIDANAPEQLAEKIRTLLSSPAKRMEMGRRATAHAMSCLNSERMIDEMESMFKSVTVQKRQAIGEYSDA